MEIGCVEAATISSTVNGQSVIDCAMSQGLCVGHNGNDGNAPEGRDGTVLTVKDEQCRACASAIVHNEAGASIENDASRIALIASNTWNRNRQRKGTGIDSVDGGLARSVIRDPPRCCGT